MSIAVVQSLPLAHFSSPATTQTTGAFGSSPTTGNTIIVTIWYEDTGATITSVTDTAGNTYVLDGRSATANNRDRCDVWRATNITGGSSFTLTANASGAVYMTITALESSAPTSLVLEGGSSTANDANNSAQPHTGALTTSTPDALIFVAFADAGLSAVTDPSGYTRVGAETGTGVYVCGAAAYKIATVAQVAVDVAWSGVTSNANQWAAVAVAYKQASSAVTRGWGAAD